MNNLLSHLTEISSEDFQKMTEGLEMISESLGIFSRWHIINSKPVTNPEMRGTFICNRQSLVKESKMSLFSNLFGICAKNTSPSKFKQGQKYRLSIGDPVKVDATLIGWTKLMDGSKYNSNFLVFKTENENYVLSYIGCDGEAWTTEILKTY
ncbi:hypothetical protein HOD29_05045 [archaeon]|jgi:hypothetical protein|nr:hypothetical protein [archaeon]